MRKYKSERYKGELVTFHELHRGFVGAKAPNRTSQYLGIGKGKKRAFADLKKSADRIDKAGNWKKKRRK